jgi:hypothetical protein
MPKNAVLFGREPHAAIGLRWTAHDHRTKIQPRREEAFPAQAQVAAWSAGRAERERAGGLISISGWSEGERAVGRFRLRAASRPGARSEIRAIGPWAVFHFRAEFHSEQ